MEPDQVTIVTKQYDWRGEHVGYVAGGMHIPLASGNRHYRGVVDRIAAGKCTEEEPKFQNAIRTYSEKGDHTGHYTNLGFVPKEPGNHLSDLLEAAIQSGVLDPKEPEEPAAQPKLKSLVLCKFFPRKWDNISAEISRNFTYRHSVEDTSPVICVVRARNLPADDDAIDAFTELNKLGYPGIKEDVQIGFMPVQVGEIELEVPVNKLLKIYRGERGSLSSTIRTTIEDSANQNSAITGRGGKGPSIDWLISESRYYLTRFFADIINKTVREFTLEYGGTPPGHVDENELIGSYLIYGRDEENCLHLVGFGHQSQNSFQLSGNLQERGVGSVVGSPNPPQSMTAWEVSTRIKQLINAGFAPESIVVASAFAERALKEVLEYIVRNNSVAVQLAMNLNHRSRLEVFSDLSEAEILSKYESEGLRKLVDILEKIYVARNEYAHDLKTPSESHWQIVEIDRKTSSLLEIFLDAYQSHSKFGTLSSIANTSSPAVVQYLGHKLEERARKKDNTFAHHLRECFRIALVTVKCYISKGLRLDK